MSSVPAEIAGIGSSAMKLRVSPGFDPLKAQVGPDEYFVLSRIDGKQTIREILLSTGLPIERGIAIVTKLRSIGALLLPGESSVPAPATAAGKPRTGAGVTPLAPLTPARGIPQVDLGRAPTVQVPPAPVPTSSAPSGSGPTAKPTDAPIGNLPNVPRTTAKVDAPTNRTWPVGTGQPQAIDTAPVQRASSAEVQLALPKTTSAEKAALAEPGDLSPAERLRLLQMARLVDARDPWALLGLTAGADAKDIKRAYFKLSKDVHPDRYYGRQLGSFADRLTAIFEAVNRAYAKLTAPDKARATGAFHTVHQAEQPQTPQEYAAELFDRACALEVGGDPLGAMKLFAAAVRIDPQTRYLRRAATCALAAEQPKTALEYAKKAQTQTPNDPSSARLLASAFRATGRLADAEEVLIMAMALKSENDVLGAELRNDLAEVRRLMSG